MNSPKKQKKSRPKSGSRQRSGKIVMVSGGFDPVHIGHVRMFEEAKKLGDELVVSLNNDNWLEFKKGFVFMPERERKEIIEAFIAVDRVVISEHKKNTNDISSVHMIKKIRPHIFANGGDRKPDQDPVPEVAVCRELGIEMVYNVGKGGKVRSSSALLKAYSDKKKR